MKSFLFLLSSARQKGNTETLARRAAQQLPAETAQQWLHLMDLPLAPFEDIRHSGGVYPQPEGHEKVLFDATLAATDIVLASPLYWYNMSASAKQYFDYWSAWLRVPNAEFRARMAGKTLWLVCSCSDEDPESMTGPLVKTMELTAAYMDMHWGGALLGYGNRPGDVMNYPTNVEKADAFLKD